MTDLYETDIHIDYPAHKQLQLNIKSNGTRVSLVAEQIETWVQGTSTYQRQPGPEVREDANGVYIEQTYKRSELTNMFRLAKDSPHLNLKLNPARAFGLTIDITGDLGELALGGLPLKETHLKFGLGTGDINFSTPHPARLPSLHIENHGGQIELRDMQNAHATRIEISGRLGTVRLHYKSAPPQAGVLLLKTTNVATTLNIPKGMALKIIAGEGGALSTDHITVQPDGAMTKTSDAWITPAADDLSPLLTVRLDGTTAVTINIIE